LTESLTDGQRDYTWTDRLAQIQTVIYRHTDNQVDRQAYGWTDSLTDGHRDHTWRDRLAQIQTVI
jgi:hypothetical protein